MTPHRELSKSDQVARLFYYRQARDRGEPTLSAWVGALRELHFRRTLRASVMNSKKRSQSAKKAWQSRKSANKA